MPRRAPLADPIQITSSGRSSAEMTGILSAAVLLIGGVLQRYSP